MDIWSVTPNCHKRRREGAGRSAGVTYVFVCPPSLVPDTRARTRGSVWGGDRTVNSRGDVPQPVASCTLDPGPWSGFLRKMLLGYLTSAQWIPLSHAPWPLLHFEDFRTLPVGSEPTLPADWNAPLLASMLIAASYHFPGAPSWLIS